MRRIGEDIKVAIKQHEEESRQELQSPDGGDESGCRGASRPDGPSGACCDLQ